MNLYLRLLTGIFLSAIIIQDVCSRSQYMITVSGVVKDTTGLPVEYAAVTVSGVKAGTYTDLNGRFYLRIPGDGTERMLNISVTGYESLSFSITCNRDISLGDIIIREKITDIGEIKVVSEIRKVSTTTVRIVPKDFRFLPSSSGSFESVLKTLPGVSSNNELSSAYSVRGGNYDENLVYINDIEISRPFLIRSGQQEGLSAINPDLVSSVLFSSGGFSAVYGDKMSSVLDISYRKPMKSGGSVASGLLLSSAHYEGISASGKVTWLAGVRYKSSRLMLKTLDSKGDYHPVFADIQGVITMKTGKRSEMSFFGSAASNTYNYIPQSRESRFGNETEAYRLFVLFQGREKDRYQTWNLALTWKYSGIKSRHKIGVSNFGTTEKENFDIRGYYSLNLLDKNTGSENLTDTAMNIGIGSFLSHARNSVNASIASVSYKGETIFNRVLKARWGIKLSHENISYNIREWKLSDSAGYSLPYNPGNGLMVSSMIKGSSDIKKLKSEIYGEIQRTVARDAGSYIFTAGARGIYNSFTSEYFICPRVSARMETRKNITAWISAGAYYQNPFYREMHFPDGSLNTEIKSQKSWHVVSGMFYDFRAWDRPFRFSAEAYNKKLENLIPYRLENVRIIYEGENIASGYSRGIDFRLNGEFVEGAESWFSLSLMDSRLKIPGIIDGMFPSPSDQTLNINIFFQDYLPGYPNYRAHITLSYVTGIPIISPFNNRYDQYHRLPSYRRVDLGLTKLFSNPHLLPGTTIKEVVAGIEIFNLLDINNTVSYFWVKTVNNLSGRSRQFAIPDYLTGRSLNFKVTALF